MKKIIILCSFIFALNAVVYCGQLSKIELTDGSVINGEIISYADGAYTIKTANFGEIKVGSGKVLKIESANYVSSGRSIDAIPQANNPTQSQVSAYSQTLMQNPENAAIFINLTSNPELQAMANDPEILEAAKANDIQALMKNAKFMDIVNSPEMQEAVKKIKK